MPIERKVAAIDGVVIIYKPLASFAQLRRFNHHDYHVSDEVNTFVSWHHSPFRVQACAFSIQRLELKLFYFFFVDSNADFFKSLQS